MKRCSKCGQLKAVDQFSKNISTKGGLFHYCKVCDKLRKKKYRINNPNIIREERRKRTERDRELVMSVYGGKCSKCPESRTVALIIHHINGGGQKHRKEIKRSSGAAFYSWLINKGFPEGYEILCGTCHLIHHRIQEVQNEKR